MAISRSKWIVLLTGAAMTAVSFSQAGQAPGSSCRCLFTGMKDYLVYKEGKNFFGNRKVYRKWKCEYTCDAGKGPEKVYGVYEMTNSGLDDGREGICEGTIYESEFSSYTMREVYMYKDSRKFDPAKAEAAELMQWAAQQECR